MQKTMKKYNDGYLHVYEPKQVSNDFGAVINPKTKNDMKFIVKLAYEERSRRAEDMEWAESCDRTLSLKVCCPLFSGVETQHQVICTGKLYSIINMDYDRENQEMYLYLEEVCDIAE